MRKKFLSITRVAQSIYFVRGQKVILGQDLAALYGVTVGALIQAVKRNPGRFPDDFAFQLEAGELMNLKSQFVISSWGGRREIGFHVLENASRYRTRIRR